MPYTSFGAAVEEACRLSQGMTLKNALADIPYGGAKSVIMRREDDARRPGVARSPAACLRRLRQPARRCLHPRGRHGDLGGRSRRHRHRCALGELQPRRPLTRHRLRGVPRHRRCRPPRVGPRPLGSAGDRAGGRARRFGAGAPAGRSGCHRRRRRCGYPPRRRGGPERRRCRRGARRRARSPV